MLLPVCKILKEVPMNFFTQFKKINPIYLLIISKLLIVALLFLPNTVAMISEENDGNSIAQNNMVQPYNYNNVQEKFLEKKDLLIFVHQQGVNYGRVKGFLDALKKTKNLDLPEDLESVQAYALNMNFSYGISLPEPDYNSWVDMLVVDNTQQNNSAVNLLHVPGYVAAVGGGVGLYKEKVRILSELGNGPNQEGVLDFTKPSKVLGESNPNSGMFLGVVGYGLGRGVEEIGKKLVKVVYGYENSYLTDLVCVGLPLLGSIALVKKLPDPDLGAVFGGYLAGRAIDGVSYGARWVFDKYLKKTNDLKPYFLKPKDKQLLIKELQQSFDVGKNANYQRTFDQITQKLSVH
jgi:hypothetical protein